MSRPIKEAVHDGAVVVRVAVTPGTLLKAMVARIERNRIVSFCSMRWGFGFHLGGGI
jgi:hypothetical protein